MEYKSNYTVENPKVSIDLTSEKYLTPEDKIKIFQFAIEVETSKDTKDKV